MGCSQCRFKKTSTDPAYLSCLDPNLVLPGRKSPHAVAVTSKVVERGHNEEEQPSDILNGLPRLREGLINQDSAGVITKSGV